MAKIGYLFLRKGIWNGRQIVSPEWVAESTKAQVTGGLVLGSGYGYQWWRGKTVINNRGIETFYAAGRGGQYIFVVPSLDTIAVFTSEPYNNSPAGEFRPHVMMVKYLIPAMLPPAPPQKTTKIDREILDAFVGNYLLKGQGVKMRVFIKDEALHFKTMGQKVELHPETKDRFFGAMKDVGEIKVAFIRNERGEVQNLDVAIGFGCLRYERIK